MSAAAMFRGEFPTNAAYTITKPILINGQPFQSGESLPMDSTLRQNRMRIQQLCRSGVLQPSVPEFEKETAAKPSPVSVTKAEAKTSKAKARRK